MKKLILDNQNLLPFISPQEESKSSDALTPDFVVEIRQTINEKLKYFSSQFQYHPELKKFIEHSHGILNSAKAKRARSCIPVLIGASLGRDRETCLLYAVIIELLHYTSLIHDDVIDNHIVRRGHPTLSSAFTKRHGVLIGDYLMCEIVNYSLKVKGRAKTIRLVIQAAKDLVAGLIIEQDVMPGNPSLESYLRMVHFKTSSLYRLSFGLPFSNDTRFPKAIECGNYFGLLFQVYDDYFDRHEDKAYENIHHILSKGAIEELINTNYHKLHLASQELRIEDVVLCMVAYLRDYGYFRHI